MTVSPAQWPVLTEDGTVRFLSVEAARVHAAGLARGVLLVDGAWPGEGLRPLKIVAEGGALDLPVQGRAVVAAAGMVGLTFPPVPSSALETLETARASLPPLAAPPPREPGPPAAGVPSVLRDVRPEAVMSDTGLSFQSVDSSSFQAKQEAAGPPEKAGPPPEPTPAPGREGPQALPALRDGRELVFWSLESVLKHIGDRSSTGSTPVLVDGTPPEVGVPVKLQVSVRGVDGCVEIEAQPAAVQGRIALMLWSDQDQAQQSLGELCVKAELANVPLA
jgi:hypothetical protein